MDTFTSISIKKFMVLLISRVCYYLTITLRSPADNRGFFYLSLSPFMDMSLGHKVPKKALFIFQNFSYSN
ncbi:hypothetical protein EXW33_28180 [Bacillus toyonensis]|nr:hypothetical protein EXW33_00560 [Bacillus toyonensis]QWG98368.1 hypothetical protein EXW33_28180 [Bacillus toyonensis]